MLRGSRSWRFGWWLLAAPIAQGCSSHCLPLPDAKLSRQVIKHGAFLLILRCFSEPELMLSSLGARGMRSLLLGTG